jgi:hypothetical protein
MRLALVLILSSLLICACGSEEEDEERSQIRFIQAAPNVERADLIIDGSTEVQDLLYSQFTDYFEIDEGSHRLQITVPGSVVPVVDINRGFGSDTYSSIFLLTSGRHQSSNDSSQADFLITADRFNEPESGQFRLRVSNMAPILESADIYLTEPDAGIISMAPTFNSLTYKRFTDYFDLMADTDIRVRVTAKGTKEVLFDSGSLTFEEGKVQTIVLLDRFAGGLPLNSIILEDHD